MNAERDLRRRVNEELAWDPTLPARGVQVVATDGTIELAGTVRSYAQKVHAEAVAKQVKDVRSVLNHIEVKVPLAWRRSDPEITAAVEQILRWNAQVPRDAIRVRVVDGWVELSGAVEWQCERLAAEAAIEHLIGIRGISNHIAVRPTLRASELKARITAALRRRADLAARDAQAIVVEAADGEHVVLRGRVHTWADRALAETTAWAAPGIKTVHDEIVVVSDEPELEL